MSLVPSCGMCDVQDNLLQCAGCKVMQYCSKDHQVAHRPQHKLACTKIRKARQLYDNEEATLREHPGDFMMQADPFNNSVGHFWGILDTRNYMRARFALVAAILKINAFFAVMSALDHLMDMLRLCRSDNLGVRDLVPALLLRLGQDQKCYDFVKWWETIRNHSDYDWGDTSLPYMNITNANVFEPVDYLCGRYSGLPHTVSIALLKVKLLLDLEDLRNSNSLAPIAPPDIIDNIKKYVPRSTLVSGDRTIMSRTDAELAQSIEDLKLQVKKLRKTVRKSNEHFWPALLDPGRHLAARPAEYSRGSVEEMQLALQFSYASWQETPGAMDFIRADADL